MPIGAGYWVPLAAVAQKLEESGENGKAAILMIQLDIDKDMAEKKLEETKGHIRKSL